MRFSAPPISQHRLHRYHRWMLLWLKWFAAFLAQARGFAPFSAQATAIAHRWLDDIERLLVKLIAHGALGRIRLIPLLKHSPRPRTDTHMLRAVMGSAVRRALRARDLNQRIEKLSQDLDALIARVAKRLPRGLTRRRPFRTRAEPRVVARGRAQRAAPAIADTS